jgi:hypothetical protein
VRLSFLTVALCLVGNHLAADAPALASLKWRGSLWGGFAQSDRSLSDGSLFLRSVDHGDGQLSLDGFSLGADLALAEGWSLKFTFLTGESARLINALNQDSGSLAYPEAMVAWTQGGTSAQFGRMWTPMGMEVLDATQDITASRGLLFTYIDPFAQVGLHVRQALSSDWNADVWVFNGEDRVKDNNRGKTLGAGLSWAPGGSTDSFLNFMAFRGPEQDSIGVHALPGAEGRMRQRACLNGQWTHAALVVQGEVEWGQERFPASAIAGAAAETNASWKGVGCIAKWSFSPTWSAYLRAEWITDDHGVRLSLDPTVQTTWGNLLNANLTATDFTVGAERRWGSTFLRGELRQDRLNRDLTEGPGGSSFRAATSATLQVGTSF